MIQGVFVPAYGRDYQSRAEVIAALNAGADFRLEPAGCYGSLRDVAEGEQFQVRYARLRKVTLVSKHAGVAK